MSAHGARRPAGIGVRERQARAAAEALGIELREEGPGQLFLRIAHRRAGALPYIGAVLSAGVIVATVAMLSWSAPEGGLAVPRRVSVPVLAGLWLVPAGVFLLALRQRTLDQRIEVRDGSVEFSSRSALGKTEKRLTGPGLKVDRYAVYNTGEGDRLESVCRMRIRGPSGSVKFGFALPNEVQEWLAVKLSMAIESAPTDAERKEP